MKKTKRQLVTLVLGWIISLAGVQAGTTDDGLKLHYTFEQGSEGTVVDASGNGYSGTLKSGASLGAYNSVPVMNLGGNSGYLDMGEQVGSLIAGLGDFTVSTYLYLDAATSITGAGNFVWAFSTSAACGQTSGKYIAYRVNAQRYAQSSGGWSNERVGIQIGSAATRGVWQHVVYTQSGLRGTIYINGEAIQSGEASLKPKDMGEAPKYNWLGRPPFSGDVYLKNASYADFRIYDRALTAEELSSFQDITNLLNKELDEAAVLEAKTALELAGLDAVRANISLPATTGDQVSIAWSSSHPEVLSASGVVTRPAVGASPATVTLTATLTKGVCTETKAFTATVIPSLNDRDALAFDLDNIDINTARCYLLGKITLPRTGPEGSSISWKSDNTAYLTHYGEIIALPAKGAGAKTVTLTATVTKGSLTETNDYPICIQEEEGYVGYLFAYFTGNGTSQEQIFFAMSPDGYTYTSLNGGARVISADSISDKQGVRDPHILRGQDGDYYMVVTDMRSSQGWTSNHGIVLLKSEDLVNWTHSRIDVKAQYPAEFGKINRAWAPQVIYDEAAGKYMVYFSMKTSDSDSYDIIYYAYANADFTAFEEAPKQLFFHPDKQSCIDGDIIYRDGKYHLFFKTEGGAKNGLKKAVSDKVNEGYVLIDRYLEQTNDAVEGSCVFRLINEDRYILMYDVYNNGRYDFTESSDLDNFRQVVSPIVSMNFTPRHGTVIPITQEEADRVAAEWGRSTHVTFGTALSPQVKTNNIVVSETEKTVYIPVSYGTDLANFDPLITAAVPGVEVTPKGTQDFSNGTVEYTFALGGTSKTYKVAVSVDNNPVLPGYYADPEILYSEKHNKFYLYPTSDGFASWGGYYFKVFSSEDLVNWVDEGVIIDMHTDQVSWANGNAWAPCIVEAKVNGEYKYFYYFSGGQDGGAKMIGVAVADDPTGPFTVSEQPLISSSPTGSGQQIDPDVFTDPQTGKSYLFWGNGYLARAELNDDRVSINTSSIYTQTPGNFTEGIYTIYRNGKYYFFWSYGNTNDATYTVYYGMADSPMGTITVPSGNNILVQNATNKIYGPGHNSVIQVPGTDDWYIVYHRISRPNGINQSSPGNFREVCIDKLVFNADGTIAKVVPTLSGIDPIDLTMLSIDGPEVSGKEKAIKVYPTLVQDVVYVESEILTGEVKATVVNLSGQTIFSKKLPAGTISVDCSSLDKGFYLMIVEIGGHTVVEKIQKR